ncbi:hypothetical protein SAMN04515667_2014 [Formosa sp. Hel1_31_208]|uniref:hypothetical protein n=1 Tax=Formosa sp. Hel1_31_208 TaxID=1798225 RepID=UPI00087DA087|nr:hypothetical protein [Formosa sp. Hel1_31_208]SDS36724.1 hypothetical protein SAMN04515667_2014 [Formosa sp. Hel1_31_208]
MKKIIFTLLLVSMSTLIVDAQEWITYKSTELGYSARFPVEPEFQTQGVSTAVGELQMKMAMATPNTEDDDNLIYSVIRSEYPGEGFIDATDDFIKNVLDGAIEGAVTNVQGTKIYDESVSFNNYPARYVKIEITGAFLYLNAYLVENMIYITQVICTPENDKNTSIKKFQESFELIKVK